MCRVPALYFFLCVIPLIKSASIKVNGLIDFGKNWNYEYHISRIDGNSLRSKTDNTAAQIKTFEDLLRTAQERLQNVSSELREDDLPEDFISSKHELKTPKPDLKTTKRDLKTTTRDLKTTKRDLKTTTRDLKTTKRDLKTTTRDLKTTKRDLKTTTRDLKTTTRDLKTTTRDSKTIKHDLRQNDKDTTKPKNVENNFPVLSDYTEETSSDTSSDNSDSCSNSNDVSDLNTNVVAKKTTKEPKNVQIKVTELTDSAKGKRKQFKKEMIDKFPTTLRTEFLYNMTSLVKENKKITDFNNYLFNETVKIISNRDGKDESVKTAIDKVSDTYKEKFKEFIVDTAKHKIKTRLGTQKVILNSIDTSTSILLRLSNYLTSAKSSTKNTRTQNPKTQQIFLELVEKAQKRGLAQACKTFGICRSENLFSGFLVDILKTILLYDNDKFKQTTDALSEELKYKDFNDLEPKTQRKLQSMVRYIENADVTQLKVVASILLNTLMDRNKPMAVSPSKADIVNSTLALLEIIDLLDAKIVGQENLLKWAVIESSFQHFGSGTRDSIQKIVRLLFHEVEENIEDLDRTSYAILLKHVNSVFK